MPKFLILWEILHAKSREDPTTTRTLDGLIERVKADIRAGRMKEWGLFAEGGKGFLIVEGSEQEVYATILHYRPYAKFTLHQYLSAAEASKVTKSTK
ncbi:MAG: hypothetical protein ACE5KO_05655 [Candidatus Bathyarchaeia archaeon]